MQAFASLTLYRTIYIVTATGHALIGTLIAAKITDPVGAYAISFFSHFAGDILPHWDSGTHSKEKSHARLFVESAIDVLIGFFLSYFLYVLLGGQNIIHLVLCIIFSQLPDWITAPYFILGIKIPFSVRVGKIQSKLNRSLDLPWGIVTQIAAVIILYLIFFKVF